MLEKMTRVMRFFSFCMRFCLDNYTNSNIMTAMLPYMCQAVVSEEAEGPGRPKRVVLYKDHRT